MKALFSALVLLASLSSFAQDTASRGVNPNPQDTAARGGNTNNGGFRNNPTADGRIDIGGGRTTLRISINDRNPYSTDQRLRRLEQAVMDLQDQVYYLEYQQQQPQTTIVRMNVCSIRTSFDGTFVGKGQTRVEAEANARNSCERARASGCGFSSNLRCEIQEEVVRY